MNGPIYGVRTGHGKPGKSWNSSEGHGKSWKSKKILRQKDKKFEEITDELETRSTFSRIKTSLCFMHYSCIMLENMIVLILLSKQMLKLWSWKTRKGHGKGH